ncbi:ribulose-phosphate 3-epimerase [Thermospira aquatica]|uniref:Ribulose-phosphate 3-epimerase n=1 Tax=Thermospira aquatica TaxID=2828656 RepID=A0AAX3BFQ4_9SPIR|nr:ribulose-phosphate 3-epimerase [Thermospira aquatica]URA11135.1 ribulose-phosphate 3-epimerase [Thermospira aquatica]
MSPNRVSPSIFAADFWALGEAVRLCEEAGVDGIHYDVMDNHFVPNISFGPKMIADLCARTSLPADVHLMIDLHRGIEDYLSLPVEIITLHLESLGKEGHNLLKTIRQRGKKAGLSLKPATPAVAVEPYLDDIDLILVMTVEPGFSGQKFMPEMLSKISEIRKIIADREILLQVDGGVNRETYQKVLKAGANFLVIGSAFFADSDPKNWAKQIHEEQTA